ncbi:hypothetical protein [Labrenzia sp. CE80]|uniref:hypothetical protein n=1 Tax=Labrenzia sp. CE80 TaxID=1788986 RepID=UPI00129A0BD3|nr:hypothetical protein [Labrenzia sp. CE80]
MFAQDELKELFREIDQSTDRALDSLYDVRDSAKVESLPSTGILSIVQFGFLVSLISLVGFWIIRSGLS